MDQRAKDLLKLGTKLFEKKGPVDALWQEIALNFYPERADFTSKRNEGAEFADHLYASYPVLARRELGNMLSAGLRPRSTKWFSIHVDNDEIDKQDEERRFLEYLSLVQWRAMYDPAAGFVRATKETDHDIVSFGNGVIKYGLNASGDGLLFRNYHLRDCAWSENAEGKIDVMHRKWCPTARQLQQYFPKTISQNVKKAAEKNPEQEFDCVHIVVPSRMYKYENKNNRKEYPFTQLYIECESETVLEETPLNYFCYVVPRWQTVANSVFGVSMATAVVLPDGRTMQVVTRTLREAGEKYTDPPMIAIAEAIRGDLALYAGGVTTADMAYDERLGEVLRPVMRDKGGYPIGSEINEALKMDIRAGFFLDKIQLPETNKDMTAFEIQRRLEEQMRAQSPIYDPITEDYSDPLCEGVFTLLQSAGAFPMEHMPESLSEQKTSFKFRSPLADLAEKQEAEMYVDIMQRIIMPAAQIDPAQLENVDLTNATRDAMRAAGWKADWFKPVEAVAAKAQQLQAQQQAQQGMAGIAGGAEIAKTGGEAFQAIQKGQSLNVGAESEAPGGQGIDLAALVQGA